MALTSTTIFTARDGDLFRSHIPSLRVSATGRTREAARRRAVEQASVIRAQQRRGLKAPRPDRTTTARCELAARLNGVTRALGMRDDMRREVVQV